MTKLAVKAVQLRKDFNRRTIFRDVTFELEGTASLAITGKNGAGKSTLIKIIGGLLGQSSGSLAYTFNGAAIGPEALQSITGFVSPYLNLYDEFTAVENLALLGMMRNGSSPAAGEIDRVLDRVGLLARKESVVRTYSSGMKQRLKYAFAIIHQPLLLLIDEPTANLDQEGSTVVAEIAAEQRRRGILVVATNEPDEESWGKTSIRLG